MADTAQAPQTREQALEAELARVRAEMDALHNEILEAELVEGDDDQDRLDELEDLVAELEREAERPAHLSLLEWIRRLKAENAQLRAASEPRT